MKNSCHCCDEMSGCHACGPDCDDGCECTCDCDECACPVTEGISFDKFVDSILLKERHARKASPKSETPQREYIKRYTHKANDRISFGGK